MRDFLQLKGKNIVITGAATGIGQAAAKNFFEAGANVYGLDIKDTKNVTEFIKTDLSKKTEIDKSISKLPERIDVLISNAGLPGNTYLEYDFTVKEVFTVNYITARYLVEQLAERMKNGGNVIIVSSTVGEGWREKTDILSDLYEKGTTFENNLKWVDDNYDNPLTFDGNRTPEPMYIISKEALRYYTLRASFDLLKQGIRLNTVAPGGVDTPMAGEFTRIAGTTEYDKASTNPIIDRMCTAEEIGDVILMMGSALSKCLDGIEVIADYGFTSGVLFNRCTVDGYFVDEEDKGHE